VIYANNTGTLKGTHTGYFVFLILQFIFFSFRNSAMSVFCVPALNSTQLYYDIFAANRAELLIHRTVQQGEQLINDKYNEKDKI